MNERKEQPSEKGEPEMKRKRSLIVEPDMSSLPRERREEEEEEQDSPPFTTLTESLRLTKREKPSEKQLRYAQNEAEKKGKEIPKGFSIDKKTTLYMNKHGQTWVPDIDCLRQRITIVAHCNEAGHRGFEVTARRVREIFWWQGLDRDVRQFVKQCAHCLKVRGGHTVPRPLGKTVHAKRAHVMLHLDWFYCQPADRQSDKQYVLVMKDDFSKHVKLYAAETCNAEETVKALSWYGADTGGIPPYLVSDGASHFVNETVQRFLEKTE